MGTHYRTGRNLGLAGTKAWLEKWFDEALPFDLTSITIPCPTGPHRQHRSEAVRGKESYQHSFLKYAARCWLEDHRIGKVSYERQVYVPPDEDDVNGWLDVIDGPVVGRKRRIPNLAPLLVPKGGITPNGINAPFSHLGSIIQIDLVCEGPPVTSVEVGATRPYNLLVPFLEGVIDQVIWIPFPAQQEIDALPHVEAYLVK